MKKTTFALLLSSALAVAAFGQKPNILPVEEIRFGTKAIGFSTLRGTAPQKFDVELRGVEDWRGEKMILARTSGGPLETPLEQMDAVYGMSGSPIFVGCRDLPDCIANGRLVGALSRSGVKTPLGGINARVTPAALVFERPSGRIAAQTISHVRQNGFSRHDRHFPYPADGHCTSFAPLGPGSAIAIFHVAGTMSHYSVGTVTWRDGDTIYSFGHEIMSGGEAKHPFAQVSIVDSLQSPGESEVLTGCIGGERGILRSDGFHGVTGEVGNHPVPFTDFTLTVMIGNADFHLKTHIVTDASFDGNLVGSTGLWAYRTFGSGNEMTARYTAKILFAGGEDEAERSVSFANTKTGESVIPEIAGTIAKVIEEVREGRFPRHAISVEVTAILEPAAAKWSLEFAQASKTAVTAEEEVFLQLGVRNAEDGSYKVIRVPFRIPVSALEGNADSVALELAIRDGGALADPRAKLPRSFAEVIAALNERLNRKADTLYIRATPAITSVNDPVIAEAKTRASQAQPLTWEPYTPSRDIPGRPTVIALPDLGGAISAYQNLTITVAREKKRRRFIF